MHYFLCLVKAVDRSSPNFLAICGESTPHYISPMSLLVRIEVHLLTLIRLLGSPHNRKRNCYCPYSPHESSKLVALNRGKVAEVFDSL